jgi:hypothetical protein
LLLSDRFGNFHPMHGDVSRSFNAQADLVTTHFYDRDHDVRTDD